MSAAPARPVVHIDEACRFCQRSAAFAKKRGADVEFTGGAPPDTLVLVEGDHRYERSDAALRLAMRMRWPWSWLGRAGLLVPRAVRDAVYRQVAKRRHHVHRAR
jgi:predicted DCC family thiol-disulfide oxidoreductase YuxK